MREIAFRWLFLFPIMKYTLKIVDGTVRHFNSFAEAVWTLNEGPQASDYKARPATDYELWRGDTEWYMVLLRSGRLVPTLDGAGTGIELIERLFGEVLGLALGVDGKPKAPHQIPRMHWQWLNTVASIAYGVYPGCIPQASWVTLSDHVSVLFQSWLGYGHNGPSLGGDTGTNSRHEVHVAYALARGDAVPEEVLDTYRSKPNSIDLRWMKALIDFPVLRGAFPCTGVLRWALVALRNDEVALTHELALQVIDVCKALKSGATFQQVDDALFQAGLLKLDRPRKQVEATQSVQSAVNPVSAKAQRLSEQLRLCRQKVDLAHLRDEREKGRLTLREYLRREADITTAEPPVEWANRVITAIEGRNLEEVIDVVSNADNKTTMGFLEKEFGVRLLKRAKRSRCVEACRLVGIESEKEAKAAIDEMERQRQIRIKRREADRLGEDLESISVVYEGEKTNWKNLIDTLIERGHTTLSCEPKGSMKRYFLMHPATRSGIVLSVKNKTVDYARCVLEARQEVANV